MINIGISLTSFIASLASKGATSIFDLYGFIAAYPAKTDVQNVGVEGNILNLMPKGVITATSTHSTEVLALDKDGVYQSYPVDAPAWKGGTWVGDGSVTHDGLPDVYAQANKATTNLFLQSEDVTYWTRLNGAATPNFETVTFSATNSYIKTDIAVASEQFTEFSTSMYMAGTGQVKLIIYRTAGGSYEETSEIVTLVPEGRIYTLSHTHMLADHTGTGVIVYAVTQPITFTLRHVQFNVGLFSEIYVPTTTAAASIPALSYTYPAANIYPASTSISLDIDYAGEADIDVITIGAAKLLEVVSGELTLSDGTNSLSIPVTEGPHTIKADLYDTGMALQVTPKEVTKPYTPVTQDTLTVSANIYDFDWPSTMVGAKEALTDVQGVDAAGNIMNLMPKGTGATSIHSTPILALDSEGNYVSYPANHPVWKGGYITLQNNLTPKGDFSDPDLSSYWENFRGDKELVNETLRLTSTGGTSAYGSFTEKFNLVAGEAYIFEVEVVAMEGSYLKFSYGINVGSAAGGENFYTMQLGLNRFISVAPSTGSFSITALLASSAVGAACILDNIKVGLLEVNHDAWDVYLQANKAATNFAQYSEDIQVSPWVLVNGAVGETKTTLTLPSPTSYAIQVISVDSSPLTQFNFSVFLAGTGTVTLKIARGSGGDYEDTSKTVTLTEEGGIHNVTHTHQLPDHISTSILIYAASVPNTFTIKYMQLVSGNYRGVYIFTSTAAASVPATNYTYPSLDMSSASFSLNYEYNDVDIDILTVGAVRMLYVESGLLYLSDGSNSITKPAKSERITVTLSATEMGLLVSGETVSGPYTPVTAGLITVSEDHYDLHASHSAETAIVLSPPAFVFDFSAVAGPVTSITSTGLDTSTTLTNTDGTTNIAVAAKNGLNAAIFTGANALSGAITSALDTFSTYMVIRTKTGSGANTGVFSVGPTGGSDWDNTNGVNMCGYGSVDTKVLARRGSAGDILDMRVTHEPDLFKVYELHVDVTNGIARMNYGNATELNDIFDDNVIIAPDVMVIGARFNGGGIELFGTSDVGEIRVYPTYHSAEQAAVARQELYDKWGLA